MRILVDTSIWVHHLSRGDRRLAALLEGGEVWCHPFVIGELACGQLGNRGQILGLLGELPKAQIADHAELMYLLDEHRLYGRDLGWVDIHLLGSAMLSSCHLWTSDKALQGASRRLGIAPRGIV